MPETHVESPRTREPPPTSTPSYAQFIAGYDPQKHPLSYVQRVLGALCVKKNEVEAGGLKIAELISIFEDTDPIEERDQPTRDGKLSEKERNRLLSSGSCRHDYRNFFEKQSFPGGTVPMSFANRLYRAL